MPETITLNATHYFIMKIPNVRKNIKKKKYKNNKLKIIAPTWNDEFELPDGSYSASDIQYCMEVLN